MTEYKHSEITHKIIGCAMLVHSFLGNGFQELIYQRALAYEFSVAGLEFSRELEMPIYYKNLMEPIGTRRVDFLVENRVLVELKAISVLEDVHLAQILNYLRAYKIEIGLLINFGEKSLNFKRVILSERTVS
jgi:GxxExxY protein